MKNLGIIVAASFLFAMCTGNQKVEEAQMRTDSLQRVVMQKDSAIYAVMGTFLEIENNLDDIKAKENLITMTVKDVEDQRSREEKINDDINAIYDLMQKNKEKVNKLEKQLKNAHIKNKELGKTIQALQDKLAEKNAEIVQLRQQLLDMNLKIDELTYTLDTLKFDNQVKTEIIKAQDESLNTAYFLIGTEKELKEKHILDKKGGFIGIGGGKNLNKDFDKELFNAIDIRNKTSFEIKSKKMRIITTHPTASYQIYGEKPIDSLVVKEPLEFWSVSKYLVIVVN
ncbi:MAG TPA: hypothetical protein DCQ26_01930 [Marinilabiliales bacterium]|nr:MAG: hypothetical protein A2W95_04765 [Bacteroidetes bacterium GWA2_40_14]OFX62606.1 MAG: hypothetical protein A2W84_06835 [Bacteroidetes bacterium GWC2_40_13]OFX74398.1 MAG: hypothetical protein A2W96_13825 [Bacteroidetes bacterium GWD2_40_43]OFX95189.1 MAG: hypothetical protein A2W97_11340 [Bacteroidetes bacterium GWE2_40_63]OFY21081.1 MAG: hypothetical protein A2W88_18510 [Bacteroidetes bacterium GWF2_40_13]OFZ30854.1 MAG: hypothetical protein A2437_11760 [Bacteroidetes bacterium RIFOXYC